MIDLGNSPRDRFGSCAAYCGAQSEGLVPGGMTSDEYLRNVLITPTTPGLAPGFLSMNVYKMTQKISRGPGRISHNYFRYPANVVSSGVFSSAYGTVLPLAKNV